MTLNESKITRKIFFPYNHTENNNENLKILIENDYG